MTCQPVCHFCIMSYKKTQEMLQQKDLFGLYRASSDELCGCVWNCPWERGTRGQRCLLSPSCLQFPIGQTLLHGNQHTTILGCWVVPTGSLSGHLRCQIHMHYSEISFKSKSDERKPDCTTATTDSNIMDHCQTLDSMIWESEAGYEICVTYSLILTYKQLEIRDL